MLFMLLISPETEVCATMVWPAGMDERPLAGGIPSPTIMRRVVAVDIPEFRLIDQRRRMAATLAEVDWVMSAIPLSVGMALSWHSGDKIPKRRQVVEYILHLCVFFHAWDVGVGADGPFVLPQAEIHMVPTRDLAKTRLIRNVAKLLSGRRLDASDVPHRSRATDRAIDRATAIVG